MDILNLRPGVCPICGDRYNLQEPNIFNIELTSGFVMPVPTCDKQECRNHLFIFKNREEYLSLAKIIWQKEILESTQLSQELIHAECIRIATLEVL